MNPLPQRYITSETGVGGHIKVRPEDFLVDEIPLYEPRGSGEHLYLRIEKTRVSHGELMSTLRRYFAVPERALGFAGMKDKQGVTRQTVSVHLPGREPASLDVPHERIRVLDAARHANKLRRGHLSGNRFAIRIRDVSALAAPAVARVLRRLDETGVPCYFGPQRFGYRRNNHLIGMRLLQADWTGALDELLGARGSPFPEYQRERRELYEQGRLAEAAALWTAADRVELSAINVLRSGRSPQETCKAVLRKPLSFWLSALQSAIFNRVLDARIDEGLFGRLVEGDLAWKHDSRAVFAVRAEDLAGPELAERLARLEISPSGPLWGRSMKRAAGQVAARETEGLGAFGIEEDALTSNPWVPQGARRPFRARLENVQVEGGMDEHGHFVRVAFDLPHGAYATVALREVMKNDATWGWEPDNE